MKNLANILKNTLTRIWIGFAIVLLGCSGSGTEEAPQNGEISGGKVSLPPFKRRAATVPKITPPSDEGSATQGGDAAFPPSSTDSGTSLSSNQPTQPATEADEPIATSLRFVQEPESGIQDTPLSSITLEVLDQNSNTMSSFSNSIQVTLGNDPSGNATIGGISTRTATAGIVTFDSLTIDQAGQGFTLIAKADSLSFSIQSKSFDITSTCVATAVVIEGNTSLPAGAASTYMAYASCQNGNFEAITHLATWSTSDAAIATMGANGQLTTVSAGSASVRATWTALQGAKNITVTAATVTSIAVSPINPQIAANQSQQFTATALLSDNSSLDVTTAATWASTDPSKAAIDADGVMTSIASGSVAVEASYGGATGTSTAAITEADLVAVTINPVANTILVGTSYDYTATAIYSDQSQRDVTALASWTSSATAIAKVGSSSSNSGSVTGVQSGSATINTSYSGLDSSSSVTILDKTLTSLSLSAQKSILPQNFTMNIALTGYFLDGSSADLTRDALWTSSNPAIATVENGIVNKGLATGIAAGNTTITANFADLSQTFLLTITSATLSQIDILPSEAFLARQMQQDFKATALFSDFTTLDVTSQVIWESSDPAKTFISNTKTSAGTASNLHLASGTTSINITAKLSTQTSSASVIVTGDEITELIVTPTAMTRTTFESQQLRAFAKFTNGEVVEVTSLATWLSNHPSVVLVNSGNSLGGLLQTQALGNTTITAHFGNHSASSAIIVSNTLEAATTQRGYGLNAFYYADQNFGVFTGKRLEYEVAHDWDTEAAAGGKADDYAVRWMGEVKVPTTQAYTLTTESDEAVRVYLNHQLVIDHFTPHTVASASSAPISLVEGVKYPLIVEYFEIADKAKINLMWEHDSLSRVTISDQYLYPPSQQTEVAGLEGMALWLDASDSTTVTTDTSCIAPVTADGDTVACLRDKSGYGRHLIQTIATKRPTYLGNAQNGLSGLDFFGGDFLQDETAPNYLNGSAAFEFFVVIKSDNANTDAGILDTEDPNGADDLITLRYDISGANGGCTKCLKGGIIVTSGEIQAEANSNTQTTDVQVIGASWQTGGQYKIFINGSLSVSDARGTGTGSVRNTKKILLGKGPKDTSATAGWDGGIYEVIYFNMQLTNAERDQVMTYLMNKWGVP